MKTDKQKLLELLDEFGIGYSEDTYDNALYVSLKAKNGEKVVGYTGFSADFKFTADESFIEVGVWE